MAYFAQFALDVPAVAMVTASHNDNGWTGVKMGAARPVTFGPEEMGRLSRIVLDGEFGSLAGGGYDFVADFPARYLADLTDAAEIRAQDEGGRRLRQRHRRRLRAATARCPRLRSRPARLRSRLHLPPLQSQPRGLAYAARDGGGGERTGADVALGFDGDGDRCGVVDNEGNEIFADKIGVMLARDLSKLHAGATFVVDVKSTGLFASDPELIGRGVKVDYWKTGHSYIKRRVRDLGALAGFEKSGHFFFNPPVGRGYDDGFVTAIAALDMLERNPGKSMADLYRELPKTWGSPTMSPACPDEAKYEVADRVTARFWEMQAKGERLIGQPIRDLVTVNGVRVTVEDGTWGLVRASSNKPELAVVVESPASEARMREMFHALDARVARKPGGRRL